MTAPAAAARKLDAGLFRGTALAPMETALGGLGVEAIAVGGCCELNTTAHGLIVDIGTQLGIRADARRHTHHRSMHNPLFVLA